MVSNENFNFKVTALFDSRSEKRVYFYLVVVLRPTKFSDRGWTPKETRKFAILRDFYWV